MFDLEEVLQILQSQEKPIEYEYRLYYNSEGFIFAGTTLKSDPILNNNYIVVDNKTFAQHSRLKVVDGSLVEIKRITGNRVQIKKSAKGYRTVRNHSNLILNDDEEFSDVEYYERRNN